MSSTLIDVNIPCGLETDGPSSVFVCYENGLPVVDHINDLVPQSEGLRYILCGQDEFIAKYIYVTKRAKGTFKVSVPDFFLGGVEAVERLKEALLDAIETEFTKSSGQLESMSLVKALDVARDSNVHGVYVLLNDGGAHLVHVN